MKRSDPAPPLPGQGNPRNLIHYNETLDACPCCGGVWRNGQPWAEQVLTPSQMATETGMSQQNITTRIRKGTIAAYLGSGTGAHNKYLIPIFEVERVKAENPDRKAGEVDCG